MPIIEGAFAKGAIVRPVSDIYPIKVSSIINATRCIKSQRPAMNQSDQLTSRVERGRVNRPRAIDNASTNVTHRCRYLLMWGGVHFGDSR